MEDYHKATAAEIARRVAAGQIRASETAEVALHLAANVGKRLNAITAICEKRAINQAKKMDRLVAQGKNPGRLAGVPVIIKDNIVLSGYPTTCGSRMLESYIPPYDATCVTRLEEAGAIIIAKANMDEFGMGSSNETSAFGPVKNPAGEGLVPGGSSGGSAAAVAASIVPVAFGSDTGGSVRQPAGFCGVVGLRPTYGAVSRFGLVAFASSLDQIGPIAGNVVDCTLAFQTVAGYDEKESTSVTVDIPSHGETIKNATGSKFRVGVPRGLFVEDIDVDVKNSVQEAIRKLEDDGHIIMDIALPHAGLAIAAYYIIANAEASSNLARFDGIRYGFSAGREEGVAGMYASSRGRGFGDEVMRRIMLGTFALSAGYHDAYYLKASKVRELIRRDFTAAFEEVDVIAMPTSPTAAFALGEKVNDPLEMYLSDLCVVPASLAGIPAISIPCGKTGDGRPVGLQLMAPAFGEAILLAAAARAEKLMGYTHADD